MYLWNTKTGSEAYSSEELLGKIESVAFYPNGKYFVSSTPTEDEDDDDEDMEPFVHGNGEFYGYTHISVTVEYDSLFELSSNSKLLAYRFSGRILVLNVEMREFVHTFTDHPSNLVKLSIFDDKRCLNALQSMGSVFLWDLATGSVVHKGGIAKKKR
ncbi:hypothetical protein J3F84DRAFT_387333 [Trichoderma pleuroticola]